MQAIEFEGQTGNLCKPSSMTEEQCGSLPYRRGQYEGYNTFESVWRPTDEERKAVAEGADIMLTVVGDGHPPVSIQVWDPVPPEGLQTLPCDIAGTING